MSLFHPITHLLNHSLILHTTSLSPNHSDIILCHYSIPSPICSTIHSSYTPPHYHPSILISSYVIIPSHHPSVQLFILHTTSLSPIHSDIILSLFHTINHLFNHSSYTPPHYHPSILISSYVIIPSHHPSVQLFILHTTSLSPIHSDIILCHYSIPSPICSTIHPTHHLTITHPF